MALWCKTTRWCISFNPRSHEGSDGGEYLKIGVVRVVSIHAPTREATNFAKGFYYERKSFNPRSHEGSDGDRLQSNMSELRVSIHAPTRGATHKSQTKVSIYFVSIHAPTRGATPVVVTVWVCKLFQSTLPRGERHINTALSFKFNFVSIHAPTRGATELIRTVRQALEFQSTLPRGERLGLYVHCGKKRCFNPRSHEGSDCMMYILLILLSLHHLFCECNYHYLCTTYILMLILCNSL